MGRIHGGTRIKEIELSESHPHPADSPQWRRKDGPVTTTPPVILIMFNRPDTARQVFETIRAAKPEKLLVVADGPRADRPDDLEKCAATRAIINEVDWDCEVHTNFSETNMGCGPRSSSGITWAFEIVDKAIIFDDDCVPSASFFGYCAELLDRYESDERVMMVSGNNRLFGRAETADSYYFSRYAHVWGWATWRRAWAKFDINMTDWPEIRDRGSSTTTFGIGASAFGGDPSSSAFMTASSMLGISHGPTASGRTQACASLLPEIWYRTLGCSTLRRRTKYKVSMRRSAPRRWIYPSPTRLQYWQALTKTTSSRGSGLLMSRFCRTR